MEHKELPCLIIQGQEQWHDDAIIIGDKRALWQLKETIGIALLGFETESDFYQSDGEGYKLKIIPTDAWEWPSWYACVKDSV